MDTAAVEVPRIEWLRVRNYRALRDLTLNDIRPFSVFIGPNGSGKSTIFDVFAFLSECFTDGLRKAWDRRNRFRELLSRGAGPDEFVEIEFRYRERSSLLPITYHLSIGEGTRGPFVAREWLQWRRTGASKPGRPFKFLDFANGVGQVVSGELPDAEDQRVEERLSSPEYLAVNTLGQFERHPRVSALRRFITGWYLSYISADHARGIPEAGPQERLSKDGDNLPNVIQYLQEQHPERLERIFQRLSQRVPRVERLLTEPMADGRLLLQLKDAPFPQPILAKFASDGTLKMLAYLIVLFDPDPPQLIGIEEPENQLHHRLLSGLAEECRGATARTQLFVTTHSPFFLSALHPEEVWTVYRGEDGYTQAIRASEMRGIPEFLESGAQLGQLWTENYFAAGDPLTNSGGVKNGSGVPSRKGR